MIAAVAARTQVLTEREYPMKFNTFTALALSCATALSACAQKADQIAPSYVSPLIYQSHNCAQVRQEAARVSGRVAELTGVQNKKAENDAVATGIALVIFWPAAFFIKGNKETSAELGRLKGELEALEQASITRKCGIVFRRAEPVEA